MDPKTRVRLMKGTSNLQDSIRKALVDCQRIDLETARAIESADAFKDQSNQFWETYRQRDASRR